MSNRKIIDIYEKSREFCSVSYDISFSCDDFSLFPEFLLEVIKEKYKSNYAFTVLPKNNLKNNYFISRDYFKIADSIKKACNILNIPIKWGGAWSISDFASENSSILDLYEKEEAYFLNANKINKSVFGYYHLIN